MKKILIVEDVAFNLDLLVQLLEDHYTIITAGDGAESVQKAGEEKPDLILMDLSLPVMDGWEASRQIKAQSDLAHIPIIAVTAHAMQGDRERTLESGCDDYITKPIDEDLLYAKLARHLSEGDS